MVHICKGKCHTYKATANYGKTRFRYNQGQKRCAVCDIFVEWEGSYCPCCGQKLRSGARYSGKYREVIRIG